ncbi:hypothetical protein [Clostridium sp. ZBS15]|uniref:hypothetical protein n=1 Tax=Clostridium sp. ZBS15 TaxID=2949969 RepID=UPI002079DDF0|nr:hypothetical protein [Clostridium sp. ZBS15]
MSLENAINYRLVSLVTSFSVADRWGYKNNSEGYKELKRVFKDKCKLITLEEFKDEIILAWIGESDNKRRLKRSKAQILDESMSDEENRELFNKICDKVKNQNKENLLTGIPDEIKENKGAVTDTIDIIDKGFAKIMKSAKNANVKLEFDKEEFDDITLAMACLEEMKDKSQLDDLDSDTFLESVLKVHNKKINHAEMPAKIYTEQMLLEIKTDFNARLNTIPINTKSRNRTKETIFDKMDYAKMSAMTLADFSSGYDELIDLYDEINKDIHSIDGLIKFYNIESRYNLIFYINVVIDLYEDTSLSKKELARQISKLALMDSYIYRASKMRFEINKLICAFGKEDETYKSLYNEINELVILKNKIVTDLLEVGTLDFEALKDEAFNAISSKWKAEIVNQIKKVDVVKHLGFNDDKKMKQRVQRHLKYLLEDNKEILLERSRLRNNI